MPINSFFSEILILEPKEEAKGISLVETIISTDIYSHVKRAYL